MIYPQRPSQRYDNFRLNRASSLAQGLVFAGLGRMPGTTLYFDSLGDQNYGAGNHGTLTRYTGAGNTPADKWVWDNYLRRNVLGLDGAADYVSVPNSSSFASDTVTFAGWLYQTANNTRQCPFSKDYLEFEFQLHENTTTKYIWWGNGSSYGVGSWTTAAMPPATWWHVVCKVKKSTGVAQLWLNGVSQGTKTDTATSVGGTSILAIGRRASGSYLFDGRTADCLSFNRALSPSEISQLADPSNVDLRIGGVPLILPLWRRVYGAAVAPSGNRRRRVLVSCGA